MHSAITVREASQKDAQGIATILHELGLYDYINNELPAVTERKVSQRLKQSGAERCNTVLVAERMDGAIIGYIAAHWFPNLLRGSVDGYISELFVLPQAAGQGVGSQLLAAIYDYASKQGCTRLLLMNRRDRESYQRAFYAKHGWEEIPQAAYFVYYVPG